MTTPRRAYPSDLSDARWALIEPIVAAWRAARAEQSLGINQPIHDLRDIVNAILYVNRTGMAWAYLPHDFPPPSTVYWYYAEWEKDGITETIHEMLRRRVREAAGRPAEPTAALADAQSVKTSSNVPEISQGIDAGKKIKGTKRHIITDTLGLLLVVMVTAASVQDTTGGRTGSTSWPPGTRAWSRRGWMPDTRGRSSSAGPRTASTSRSSPRILIRRASSHCRSGGPWSGRSGGWSCIGDVSEISRLSRNVPSR